ncbi:MAG TPA: substrate-binding domain-containing protein [Actinomycetota bacterium]|nr:substrate-binding domain-containing protein [Actinomycetota bacterium]
MRRSEAASRRGPKLLWLLLGLVAVLALVGAGCGGDDDEGGGDGEGSVWVLLPDSATSPRWESDDRRYFEQAFTEADVEFNIVNAEGDAAQQQSQAEQAIADGASVILLVSNDTGSGATIIDNAKDADVDVVEYDRFNTGGSGGAAYVSFDNVEVGRTMGRELEPAIDALDKPKPRVVMLNGGEEDNNSFLFRTGYNETVKKRVDAGDWELVADRHVPGWDNQQAQTLMEQILTSADNNVDAVFAANDGLGNSAINAMEAAGIEKAPVSGQDATVAGIQNILLGKQTMTVYKPIKAEADVAAAVALALRNGEDINNVEVADVDFNVIGINAEDGNPAEESEGDGIVPYFALTPIGVTAENIQETVIEDGFRTVDEICKGDTAQTDFCQEQS